MKKYIITLDNKEIQKCNSKKEAKEIATKMRVEGKMVFMHELETFYKFNTKPLRIV